MEAVDLSQAHALNAERERAVDEQLNLVREWTRILKGVDPSLSLVWVGENSHASGVIPGRWAVRKINPPPAAHSYLTVAGPNGEYREPAEDILRELDDMDLWKRDGINRHKQIQQRIEDAKVRARKLEQEGRIDNASAAVRAARRVSGERGMSRRMWGRDKPKGTKGIVG